jgi:hypothetical protein
VASAPPAAIGLPELDQMLNGNGDAYADGGELPCRFGVFFFGNGRGVVPERWTPAQSGATWELAPQMAALAPYKQYLNVLSGMDIQLQDSPQGHHNGSVGVLSAHDFITQDAGNAPYRSTFQMPSIDQVVAEQFGAQTPFRSLEIGISERVNRSEGTTLQFISHNGPDNANPAEFEPSELFDRLFSGAPVEPPAIAAGLLEMRQSVLDNALAEIADLTLRVGTRDRVRLEQHVENIRAIERRLTTVGNLGAQCTMPMAPPSIGQGEGDRSEPIAERMAAMSDLLALALACDLTRVFTIQFTGSVASTVFQQVGLSTGHHELSHEGDASQDQMDAATTFTMEQLGVLLGALASVTEGTSTLLGQSIVLTTSDCSDGTAHSVRDYPLLLSGGGGGFVKSPGSHYASDGENVSKALFTLARYGGYQGADFGGGGGLVTESLTAIEA